MTSIQQAIYDRLSNGTVTSTVSDRIYTDFAPHDASMPFVVYTLDRTSTASDFTGSGDFGSAEFSVMCFGSTYDEAYELTFDVRRDLQDWSDEFASPAIRWCHYVETIESQTVGAERSEKRRYRKDVFFSVQFEERTADTF